MMHARGIELHSLWDGRDADIRGTRVISRLLAWRSLRDRLDSQYCLVFVRPPSLGDLSDVRDYKRNHQMSLSCGHTDTGPRSMPSHPHSI